MELEFVRWLQESFADSAQRSQFENDAATILWNPDRNCVVTTDLIADGTHFYLESADPRRIGHKALAVNLSDLAAMGSQPVAAFVSLLLPTSSSASLAKEIMLGMQPLSQRCKCPILGGDTNCWDGKLVINVAVLGEVPRDQGWKRSGVRVGDILFVTGSLGGSLRGHHLDFEPRIEEALFLRDNFAIHAAIDLSDGLSSDATRLAAASRCGLEFNESTLPISPVALQLAADQKTDPLRFALHDGEDFELLFAIDPAECNDLIRCWPFETRLSQIGIALDAPGLWIRRSDGRRTEVKAGGYEHKMT